MSLEKNSIQPYSLEQLRHSTAHLLAHAVFELFPETQLTIGPATPDGFFYDFLPRKNFKLEDLIPLEERMREITKRNLPLTHTHMSKQEARELFKNNPFKLELIDGIQEDVVGIAQQGEFLDLCKGGHVGSTGDIKFFKLHAISGSYWRADKNGTALQRINGTAFFSQEDLDNYERKKNDAIMYDHRKVGKQLDYFSFHDEGVGFPFFHAKGKIVLNTLRTFMQKTLQDAHYLEIETPMMLSDELWRCSGHYDFYRNNMYFSSIDEKHYAIKPMNCPGSIILYKERPRSYRELPLRLMEFGKVHRHELSGVLHGLFRVRAFTIDDTHIYCTLDQIEEEIIRNINVISTVMKKCGIDKLSVVLSTRPEKSMGSDEMWEKAVNGLKTALEKANLPYQLAEGDGAFYGPKIDLHIRDALNRTWQCGTFQLDMALPEKFELEYTAPDGSRKRPVMIHRTIYGSLERFFGVLIEHFAGRFPLWLSPLQVRLLTVADRHIEYAEKLLKKIREAGFHADVDHSGESVSKKVRNAQLTQINYILTVGDKEMENHTLNLRTRNNVVHGELKLDEFLQKIEKEKKERSLTSPF